MRVKVNGVRTPMRRGEQSPVIHLIRDVSSTFERSNQRIEGSGRI